MPRQQTRIVTYDTYKITLARPTALASTVLLHAERDKEGNIKILVFPKLLTIENVMEFNEWVQSPPLPPSPEIGEAWVGEWKPERTKGTFTHVRTGQVFQLKEEKEES